MIEKIHIRTKYGDIILRVIRTPPNKKIEILKSSCERIYYQEGIKPTIVIQEENKRYIFPMEAEYVLFVSEEDKFKLFIKTGKNPNIKLENQELTKIANYYKKYQRDIQSNVQSEKQKDMFKKIAKEMNVPIEVSSEFKGKKVHIGNFIATVNNAIKRYLSLNNNKIIDFENAKVSDKFAKKFLEEMGIYTAESKNPSKLIDYVIQCFNNIT